VDGFSFFATGTIIAFVQYSAVEAYFDWRVWWNHNGKGVAVMKKLAAMHVLAKQWWVRVPRP